MILKMKKKITIKVHQRVTYAILIFIIHFIYYSSINNDLIPDFSIQLLYHNLSVFNTFTVVVI